MARTWLVTGSSKGFGRALCEAILDAGDNLLETARDPDQLSPLPQRGVAAIERGDRARLDELERWRALSTSIDFPEQPFG